MMLSSLMLDSMSELSLVATFPTSSAILSDLLMAAEGASSAIESDSARVFPFFFYFLILLAEELAFWISSAMSLSKSSLYMSSSIIELLCVILKSLATFLLYF